MRFWIKGIRISEGPLSEFIGILEIYSGLSLSDVVLSLKASLPPNLKY